MASISTIRRRLPGLCTVSTLRRFRSASRSRRLRRLTRSTPTSSTSRASSSIRWTSPRPTRSAMRCSWRSTRRWTTSRRDDGERAQGGVHPHCRDRRAGQRGAEAHSIGGAGGRGRGANGRDQPVQTRRLAAHREKGEAGTGARSRLVSGN